MKTYITAKAEDYPTADWKVGAVAYYNFDNTICYNSIDSTKRITFLRAGTNSKPVLETDDIRNGKFAHLSFGANGNESYVSIPNPFYKNDIEEGVTLSFWVKRTDDNVWDALFGFYNKTKGTRLYMSGGTYVGYNNNAGNWVDINYPTAYNGNPITVGKWHFVTVTISRKATSGIVIYVDGAKVSDCTCSGSLNGADIVKTTAFDYNLIIEHIVECSKLTLGYGSFWGSPDVCFDDLIIHDRILSRQEMSALRQMMSRVYDIGEAVNIEEIHRDVTRQSSAGVYDLSGRQVTNPAQGIYIHNGKKYIIR